MDAKKMGRPPKPEAEKRQQIGVRTSPELKDLLESSAATNGRSVAQEAEYRLLGTFEAEAAYGGEKTALAMKALAAEIVNVESRTGKSWREDMATFTAVRDLINHRMGRFSPPLINKDKIAQAREIQDAATKRLEAQLEYLCSVGAIRSRVASVLATSGTKATGGMFGRGPGLLSLDGPLSSLLNEYREQAAPSERHVSIRDALFEKGYTLLLDLDKPASEWLMHGLDGQPVRDELKPSIAEMLAMIPSYVTAERDAREATTVAGAEQADAEQAGENLADEIAGFKLFRPYRFPLRRMM